MKRFILLVAAIMMLAPCTEAYSAPKGKKMTAIEKLVESFAETEGATALTMKGLMLGLAKQSLKDTPAKVLLDNLESITMFMMDESSEADIKRFCEAADETLKNYVFIGEEEDEGDVIRIYVDQVSDDGFKEMVMYFISPETALMSMKGNFTEEVMKSVVEEE